MTHCFARAIAPKASSGRICVDDDQVEQLRNLGQILRHRDRRHHEAGLELAGGGPRPKKQVAERQRASLQGNLILNEGALGEIARPADHDARLDPTETQFPGDARSFEFEQLLVELRQRRPRILELEPREPL